MAVSCFVKNDITLCKSPLKVAEYMACGKAIVASDVGELKNMVGGVGLLTKPGDVDSLSYGIDRILKNEPLGKTLGVLARERAVEKYNWEYTAMNLLKAYNFAFYLRNRSHYELILQASKDAKLEKDEDNNTFMEFESFIKFDGIYDISLKYASTSKRQGASYLDNGLINHFYFDTHTSDKEKFKWLRIKRIYLKSNFHKLKLVFGDFPTDVSHVKFFKVK